MNELPIDNETFRRCQTPITIEDFDDQDLNAPVNFYYSPRMCAEFNLQWNLPEDHININAYGDCIPLHPTIPIYRQPNPNTTFPNSLRNPRIRQPNCTSLLPLLITAHRNNINISQYQIISERNSLRKIAMNNEDYVIGVQKFGSTLFLRRYDHRTVNMNDDGHLFERMCTPNYNLRANYHQLIEGRFGNLRTLITAETDAIDQEHGQAIELKCRSNGNISAEDLSQYWLQAFLGGVTTIMIGYRIKNGIQEVHNLNVANMINEEQKNRTIKRLYGILQTLTNQVMENEVYLFSRRKDQQIAKRQLYLYKVTQNDKQQLTFITQSMLDQLFNNNEDVSRRTSIRCRNSNKKKKINDSGSDDNAISSSDGASNWAYDHPCQLIARVNLKKSGKSEVEIDCSDSFGNSACDPNVGRTSRLEKVDRMKKRKRDNVSFRRAENQRK